MKNNILIKPGGAKIQSLACATATAAGIGITTYNNGAELLNRKVCNKKSSFGIATATTDSSDIAITTNVVALTTAETECKSKMTTSAVGVKNATTNRDTSETVAVINQNTTTDIDRNKKKRCSDRYDSSESSDSGVATSLSCTDSSTTSSDASDPGSPYSPLSLGDDGQQTSKLNMPPQTTTIADSTVNITNAAAAATRKQKQCISKSTQIKQSLPPPLRKTTTQWPWNNSSISITPTNTVSNNGINKHKRYSSSSVPTTDTAKKTRITNNNCSIESCSNDGSPNQQTQSVAFGPPSVTTTNPMGTLKKLKAAAMEESQTKITGYFKSQMKSLNVTNNKKDQKTADITISPINKFIKIISSNEEKSPTKVMSNGGATKSLKKLERSKPTKIAQVAPNLRKTTSNILPSNLQIGNGKSPKKHVAIAPRTAEIKNNQKANAIEHHQSQAPTVLLTTIHIPNNGQQSQQQSPQITNSQKIQTQPTNSTPIYQIPVMPNLVQIPNLLTATTNRTNLVVNNSAQITGIANSNAATAQYFLNGAVFKFQPFTTSSTPTNTIPLDTTCLSNILMKTPGTMPLQATTTTYSSSTTTTSSASITSLQSIQPSKLKPGATKAILSQAYNNQPQSQHYASNQRLSARPVFMATATAAGLLLNAALPTMLAATTSKPPNSSMQQPVPALHPIQPNSPVMPPLQPTTSYLVNQTDIIRSNIAASSIAASTNKYNKHLMTSTQPPPLVTISSNTSGANVTQIVNRISLKQPNQTITNAIKKIANLQVPLINVENEHKHPFGLAKEVDSSTNDFSDNSTTCPLVSHYTAPTIKGDLFDLVKNSKPEKNIITKSSISSPKSTVLEEIRLKTPPKFVCTAIEDASTSSTSSTVQLSIASTETDRNYKLNIVSDISLDISNEDDTTKSDILPSSAVSPILSQPKTIRFPAAGEPGYRYNNKGAKRHDGVCYWDKCNKKHESSSKLLDHMQTHHVNTQTGPFSCLWMGCKVHGRESCSRRWLERHVLSHGGTKPFKCIVDGCGLRFGSQLALQKHVNGHFNAVDIKDNLSKRTSDPPVPKVLKKNGKKLRYRRQPFSARRFDFIDAGVMEGINHRIRMINTVTNDSNSITFLGESSLRRTTLQGKVEYLVKWKPSEIIPDEWMSENDKPFTKTVDMRSMKNNEKINVASLLISTYRPTSLTKSETQKKPHCSEDCAITTKMKQSTFLVNSNEIIYGASKRKQSRKPPKRTQPPS